MNEQLELAGNAIDVWVASLDVTPAGQSVLAFLLSPDETERANQFIFEIDRQRFIAARGILRSILGRYCDQQPASIRFAYGKQGKPFLPSSHHFFNISHSANTALIAVTRTGEVGIDLEYVDPGFELSDIIRHYFAPGEIEVLSQQSGAEHREGFYNYWTRKEAYLKARGIGLIDDLPRIDSSHNLAAQSGWFHLIVDGILDPGVLMRDIPTSGDFRATLAVILDDMNSVELLSFRIQEWAMDAFLDTL
jgi:4'-phosphopantetheinyl transferase